MKFYTFCLIALFAASISTQVRGQEITCSHPQLCNIVRALHNHQLPETLQLRSLNIQGDPHHYEPGTRELANLMRAPYLIAGPEALHPWIRPVLQHRQRAKLPTLSLDLDSNLEQKYAPSTLEAISHFWLLPELFCQYKQRIQQTLKEWINSDLRVNCEDKALELLETRLQNIKNKQTLILSHDALEPYLRSLGFQVFTLKGSHHGESITAQTLKSLRDLQKTQNQMLWVLEEGIQIPEAIRNLMRKKDTSIQVDILGRDDRPATLPLKHFMRELIKVHPL
jgi:ABC-type Zn uptake system ZnuABC Zn-binding protein ZnuA